MLMLGPHMMGCHSCKVTVSLSLKNNSVMSASWHCQICKLRGGSVWLRGGTTWKSLAAGIRVTQFQFWFDSNCSFLHVHAPHVEVASSAPTITKVKCVVFCVGDLPYRSSTTCPFLISCTFILGLKLSVFRFSPMPGMPENIIWKYFV